MPDDGIVREILEQILDALHKIQWRFASIKLGFGKRRPKIGSISSISTAQVQ